MGKLDRVLLIRVTLPPLDKYKHFQLVNLLSIFSRIGFHIVLSLNLAPKGRPRYFIGRVPCLQPRTFNNKSILCTTPTGTNSDVPKSLDPTPPQTKKESYRESKSVLDHHHKKFKRHPQKGDETPPRIFPPSYPH